MQPFTICKLQSMILSYQVSNKLQAFHWFKHCHMIASYFTIYQHKYYRKNIKYIFPQDKLPSGFYGHLRVIIA